jgi:MIP family channel proteins
MRADMLRRYACEFLGTFALVFFGCGTRIMVRGETQDFAGILMVHITFGFTIAVMVYTVGHISGAHFNPAITLGFATARRFPWRYVFPYWLAQFAGVLFASTMHFLLFPDKAAYAHYGATTPKIGLGQALVLEIILTFLLMLVSMAVATDRRVNKVAAGIAVGFTIILCGLFGNSLTGGSMNPARSLGPAVFAGSYALDTIWIYFLGPVIGALLGAFVYEGIRGEKEEAKCVPEELCTQDGSEAKEKREDKVKLPL